MQTSHVETVGFIENVLQVENLLGIVKGSQQRIVVLSAVRQFLAREVVLAQLVVWLP